MDTNRLIQLFNNSSHTTKVDDSLNFLLSLIVSDCPNNSIIEWVNQNEAFIIEHTKRYPDCDDLVGRINLPTKSNMKDRLILLLLCCINKFDLPAKSQIGYSEFIKATYQGSMSLRYDRFELFTFLLNKEWFNNCSLKPICRDLLQINDFDFIEMLLKNNKKHIIDASTEFVILATQIGDMSCLSNLKRIGIYVKDNVFELLESDCQYRRIYGLASFEKMSVDSLLKQAKKHKHIQFLADYKDIPPTSLIKKAKTITEKTLILQSFH
jgi:hypothetical protein